MKIGILGSGNMGRALGGAWANCGHSIFFGSRNPEKGKAIAEAIGLGTQGGTNDDAANFGEVIFQTVRSLPSEFLNHPTVLVGKPLMDCNNRPVPEDLRFGYPLVPSFAEQLAADVPGVRVVKVLNTMAQEVFDHSPEVLRQHGIACFLVGDDSQAKQTVKQLTEEIGLNAIDCGPLNHAWLLEAAGDLIRYIIIGENKGTYATFGVPILPPTEPRFGGRQSSEYR